MNKVLFLCTGNYYRSRFAENMFNKYASKQGLDWEADSRGLALERGANNVGAMSRYAVAALAERGITISPDERFPQQATESDFSSSQLVIALDEEEHTPLMQERFPEWEQKIEYWLVHDVDKTSPEDALGEIERRVIELIEKLIRNS